MLGVVGEEEDVFFDSRSSVDSRSSGISVEIEESVFEKFGYGVWTREPVSVSERRSRFLLGTGLDEFVSAELGFSQEAEGIERVTESSGAELDSLSSVNNDGGSESKCCITDLDSGKRFVFQDLGQDCTLSMVKEIGTERFITFQEFETLIGLTGSSQLLMGMIVTPSRETQNKLGGKHKRRRSWWRRLSRLMMGMCKSDVFVQNSILCTIEQRYKRCLESSAMSIGQEIHAHKGSIRTMRFSPSGWFLASGGEDFILRVWQVGEVEALCKCFIMNSPSQDLDNNEHKNARPRPEKRSPKASPLVIPKKVFKIRETPVQEFHGHTNDILDISWSNADYLLSSSKDKTVRMWKVGCSGCLKIFQHKDYVTCIQFNPVDDRYFISGSIDGKIRIWDITENRVVDWSDIRDIVTAICYRPDGKGFVVGSITGSCRSYYYEDNSMQLDVQFYIQGKRKSAGKRITGLQFFPEDSERIMVTSADSKVRIFDGVDVIHKFLGLWRTKSHSSASFTTDGRCLVSVGEDSNVYIWHSNIPGSSTSKGVKSIRSSDHFFCKGVTVALPWPGVDHTGGGLRDAIFRLQSPLNILDPSTWLKDSGSRYLGSLLLDGLSRKSPTWPVDILPRLPVHSLQTDTHIDHCHLDLGARHLKSPSSKSLVIVTASSDGSIRSFHNYGLPVRL